jgi:ABC-type sugar transport system substrate-binding protein
VVLNRDAQYLDRLHLEFPELPCFSAAVDHAVIGRMQGRQWKALLPRGGEVLYVQGPPTTWPAQRRFEGAQEELRGSGITVNSVFGNWTVESGEQALAEWLETSFRAGGSALQLVGAQNDAMAMGARKTLAAAAGAYAEPRLAHLPITGCGGSPTYGLRLVRTGELAATIVIPPASAPAIEWLAKMREEKKRPPRKVVLPATYFPEQLADVDLVVPG